jgi:hypothetical protein
VAVSSTATPSTDQLGEQVKFRVVLAGVAIAVLVASTACSGATPGQAKPAAGATAAGPASSSAPSSSSGASSSLKDVDPCTLLTKSEAQQVGATGEPKPEKIGSAQTCGWKPDNAIFSVVIRTNVGLTGVQPAGQVTDIAIGQHQVKKFMGAAGSCIVATGITSSSRVDVVLHGPSKVDPCPQALQVAQLVEPKLP